MAGDTQLRTRVVRYLKDQDGEECTIEEISEGTGLTEEEIRRGIDHNLFVDSLRPNLYYGVIQRIDVGDRSRFRFNRAQYVQNRSRWIDSRGRERRDGGGGGLTIPRPRLPRWFKRKGGD
ncbi:MAG: hypothetical protein KY455_04135 [Euryarchaeota archaeon]|nr:hypothetical protein [Euryarchaeota archaeon]